MAISPQRRQGHPIVYIRKAAFMNLSKFLDGAIKRCKGDMHAKPF